MKTFAFTVLALLLAAAHGAPDKATYLRRLAADSPDNDNTGTSADICFAGLGATCDDDEDCCDPNSVCTAYSYTAEVSGSGSSSGAAAAVAAKSASASVDRWRSNKSYRSGSGWCCFCVPAEHSTTAPPSHIANRLA